MSTDSVTDVPVEQGSGQATMSDLVAAQFTAQIETHGSAAGSGPTVGGQPPNDANSGGAGRSKSGVHDGQIHVPPLPELSNGNTSGSEPQPETTAGEGATSGGKPAPGRRGEGHPPGQQPARPDVCTPEDPHGDGSKFPPMPPGMSVGEYLIWLVTRPNPREGGGKKGS